MSSSNSNSHETVDKGSDQPTVENLREGNDKDGNTAHQVPSKQHPTTSKKRSWQEADQGERRQSLSTKCDTTTLYVNNLHPRLSEAHLEKLFQPFGEIIRIHIAKSQSPSGQPNRHRYAFVEYKQLESAKVAIQKIDGRSLLGNFLVVRPAINKNNSSGYISGKGDKLETSDKRLIRKETRDVENKIQAIKRAIAENKRRKDELSK